MSLFQLLDQYTINEILKRAKSYKLTDYLYSQIEDQSLMRDLDTINNMKSELREFVEKEDNPVIPLLLHERINYMTIIAVKREFIDLLDRIETMHSIVNIIVKYGSPNLVRYYIDKYDLDEGYMLLLCIYEERIDCVTRFVERGVTIKDITVFHAIEAGDSNILKSILDNYKGSDLNDFAFHSIELGRLDILIEILNRRDSFDISTLIETSVLNNRLEITKYLIERFEIVDFNHWFEYAVFYCSFEQADYFVERGVDNLEDVIERAEAMDIDCIDSILDYLYGLR